MSFLKNTTRHLRMCAARRIAPSGALWEDGFLARAERRLAEGLQLGGVVEALNPDGSVKWRGKNVVTLRGRLYSLEKLFDESPAAADIAGEPAAVNQADGTGVAGYTPNSRGRAIAGFRVGNGTTAEDSDQANLVSPVPFRRYIATTAAAGQNSADYAAGAERNKYFATTAAGVKVYHTKKLDSQTSDKWEYDTGTDTTARKLKISIGAEDFKSDHGSESRNADATGSTDETSITELGLFVATVSGQAISAVEMYSRMVFPAEIFTGAKALEMKYHIFA